MRFFWVDVRAGVTVPGVGSSDHVAPYKETPASRALPDRELVSDTHV